VNCEIETLFDMLNDDDNDDGVDVVELLYAK